MKTYDPSCTRCRYAGPDDTTTHADHVAPLPTATTVLADGTLSIVGVSGNADNSAAVQRCANCHEKIHQGERPVDWLHSHTNERECWTGDGAVAYPSGCDGEVSE